MMTKAIIAGGVVLNPQGQVLVVSQTGPFGESWSLPKGHVEPDEDLLSAAQREVLEETGVEKLTLVRELGSYERGQIDNPTNIRTIHLFLFTTDQLDLRPGDPLNPVAKWLKKEQVAEVLTAKEDREFFKSIKF